MACSSKTAQQICNNESVAAGRFVDPNYVDQSNLQGLKALQAACSPGFRSTDAGCEAITCTAEDYLKTQLLGTQLCGSLYESNRTLSSSVSYAIASATAAAEAAVLGKDVTSVSALPPCGVCPNSLCIDSLLGYALTDIVYAHTAKMRICR